MSTKRGRDERLVHWDAERGYILVGVLILLALSSLLVTGMLEQSGSNAKTRAVVTTQARYYYEVEETTNKVVTWLQENSKNLVTAFTAGNFEANFDLGSPSTGDNEGQYFSVPTLVKMKGTNDSVLLSNNDFFGESAFPPTTHIDTNVSFDAVAEFEAADFGGANARAVLTWARFTNGDYQPIFRIDVVTGNSPDRGVHSWSYVYSSLVSGPGAVGFCGRDYLTLATPNNDCFSYQFTNDGTTWDSGAQRSNCPVASNGPVSISSDVHGTADTLLSDGITLAPPGGNVSNGTCTGSTCASCNLPPLTSWASNCPGVTGTITLGPNAGVVEWSGGCWENVVIKNGTTLRLSDTTAPYYIKYIDFQGGFLDFGTIPANETVTLNVEKLNNNDHVNGNELFNLNNAPHQVQLNYLGTTPLYLNGTVEMRAQITAPYADVEVLGNFSFYGGIQATGLNVIGNARINYDEALGGVIAVSDLNFALRKTSQRYR